MGFPKGALASPLVKGGVKTPSAKWLRCVPSMFDSLEVKVFYPT